MPEQSGHRIEQRLMEYARQRREAMGADFEMPPAARHLLLAEVTREYRPRAGGEPSWWGILWQRLAWAGAVGAAALLVLWPMLYRSHGPVPKTAMDSAQGQPQRRAIASEPSVPLAISAPAAPAMAPQVAVMNSFQWRQEGNAIRIRDEDGSIYVGEVVPDQARDRELVAKAPLAQSPQPMAPAIRQRTQAAPSAAPSATREPLSQNVLFRAAGTNHSLNQKVEIEGELATDLAGVSAMPGPTLLQAAPTAAAGAKRTQVEPTVDPASRLGSNRQESPAANPAYLLFQNTAIQTGNFGRQYNRAYSYQAKPTIRNAQQNQRIQGQATIGGTNRIVIDAVPSE